MRAVAMLPGEMPGEGSPRLSETAPALTSARIAHRKEGDPRMDAELWLRARSEAEDDEYLRRYGDCDLPKPPPSLTVADVAQELGIEPRRVRLLIADGRIRTLDQVSGRWGRPSHRIAPEEVERYRQLAAFRAGSRVAQV